MKIEITLLWSSYNKVSDTIFRAICVGWINPTNKCLVNYFVSLFLDG